MKEKILSIMKSVFELDSVDTSCSQSSCEKWDSLHHLNLVVELEMEFDISLEPEEIANMKSFNDVERILKAELK